MLALQRMILNKEVQIYTTSCYDHSYTVVAIDVETFNTMWELSSGTAPGCFLRLPQTEYYREEPNLDTLKLMPNVCEELFSLVRVNDIQN